MIVKMYLFVYNSDNTKIEARKNPRADKGAEAEQNIGGRVYAVGELLKQEHDEEHEQGYKTGYEKGYAEAAKMLELVSRLIADGKTDCIPRLKDDKDFYQEMLKEYHL